MIDNIKFYINDKHKFEHDLEKHQKIPMKGRHDIFTGEVLEYPKLGKFNNLDVRLTQERATITGSLHKFNNIWVFSEHQNYNDFNICEIDCVTDFICDSLNIDPNQTKVTNLEFGFNILVEEDPQKILDRILMYNFKSHNRNETFKGRGDFKEFYKTDYSLKLYNKSKQFMLKQNILRVELKITRSRLLNDLGIYCLSDLNKASYLNLFEAFLERFDKLIIVDSLNVRSGSKIAYNDLLVDGLNPNYWLNLQRNETRNVNAHRKGKFKQLYNDIYSSHVKNHLRNSLISKFNELMNCNFSEDLQKAA